MTPHFLIYRDYGVSDTIRTEAFLKETFPSAVVGFTDAAAIRSGSLSKTPDAVLIVGGGAATPYFLKLEAEGNTRIRDFVENGGVYLGICAGAYYACTKTVFERDVPALRVCENYGLDLVDATAVGTMHDVFGLKRFAFNAFAQTVALLTDANGVRYAAHYYGGPFFDLHDTNVDVLAFYEKNARPAVVFKKYGAGKVLLSGVHFENTGDYLKKRSVEDAIDAKKTAEIAETMTKHEGERARLAEKIGAMLF